MKFSLRTLQRMADAKRMNEWDQTASIMTIVVNMFADKDNRVAFEQLHPMRRLRHEETQKNDELTTEQNSQMWDMLAAGNTVLSSL